MSEALLVPDRCRFLHKEQMEACESYIYWHSIAKEVRRADKQLADVTFLNVYNCGTEKNGFQSMRVIFMRLSTEALLTGIAH